MNGGICLALVAVHLLVWLRARDTWVNLAFLKGKKYATTK
jgi:hypothetical protein